MACLPAWGHEAYYVYLRQGAAIYQADDRRLDACRWYYNRTAKLASLYFLDPLSGSQLVATFPQAGGPGLVRYLPSGRAGRRHQVSCKAFLDSRFLYLSFQGKGIEGDIWLDLEWENHGH